MHSCTLHTVHAPHFAVLDGTQVRGVGAVRHNVHKDVLQLRPGVELALAKGVNKYLLGNVKYT